jgi:hypothetical protein
MELDRIEKLLEKYFEAETTEAEERILRDYFTSDSVAEHLKEYSTMFSYFSHAKEERFTKQVPLKPRVNYYKWISVAAVAVMVFGIYFGKSYQEQREAEYAYQQTKKALGLLASNLDRGTRKVAYLNEFQETKQKIYKNN